MRHHGPRRPLALLALPALLVPACAPDAGGVEAPAAIDVGPATRPIAIVDGARIELADVQAALLESRGAEIVRDRALDRAVAREATRRDVDVDEAAIARERDILVSALAEDPDRAERLLAELRAARGLGPTRFASLLRRNALLRALVSDEVRLDEEIVRAAWDRAHGPTRVARVIAVRDLREAEIARARIEAGEDFAVVAVESSIDSSASRGGRLAPISRLDPAWPTTFRSSLFALEPGVVSEAIPVDGRLVLLEVLEERPGDATSFEAGREAAEQAARLAAERLLMDRLARRLVPPAAIEPLDPSLRWSLDSLSR
ncbi:MAG: peptidyl-prolyl cis-trans isomerase [Planctomycetota bacterium]|nr:peptidyl-prolyl cis-trans isomerase [Planctomycetota bacterium]